MNEKEGPRAGFFVVHSKTDNESSPRRAVALFMTLSEFQVERVLKRLVHSRKLPERESEIARVVVA